MATLSVNSRSTDPHVNTGLLKEIAGAGMLSVTTQRDVDLVALGHLEEVLARGAPL